MRELLIIALGGATGAVSRYLVSGWVGATFGDRIAFGTLAVNVIGCFVLGGFSELARGSELLSPELQALIGVGFLGAFTTFSTFGNETWRYVDGGDSLTALLNVGAQLGLGLSAVALGITLARAWLAT